MSPQTQSPEKLYEEEDIALEDNISNSSPTPEGMEWNIVWTSVVALVFLHLSAVYGLYVALFRAMWTTNLFALALCISSSLGITAGAHRLWSHKSYKARLPLRFMLVVLSTISFQHSIFTWARDHRLHHKFSDTDADPTNVSRGVFFAHIGWLMVRKHPQVIAKGQIIDVSDLLADPLLRFQKKYFNILGVLMCLILPTIIPALWGESIWNGYFVPCSLRYIYTLNIAFCVNSYAHMYGMRPYNKFIRPIESRSLSILTCGEGFHNFHHTFPWDYRTSELGFLNFTTSFLDLMAKIGWAYDFKTVSLEVLEKRSKRTGDGSRAVWGWDDPHISIDEKKDTIMIRPENIK